jgi:hypothetical protein
MVPTENPYLRAVLKGAAVGLALSVWVLLVLALARLIVSPHLGEMGMLNLTAEQALSQLAPQLSVYLAATPTTLAAELAVAITVAGALAGLLLHLVNPQHGGNVGDAMRFAVIVVWPVPCVAAAILIAQLCLSSTVADSVVIVCTLLAIILLPFSCVRPEVVSGAGSHRWWRPAFPGWKPLGLWAVSFALTSLMDELDVLDDGPLGFLEASAMTVAEQITLQMGLMALMFRLDWKSLLRTLKTSRLRSLIGAWIDLNTRFFVGLLFATLPFLCLGVIAYFVEPLVAKAAGARGMTESFFFSSLRHLTAVGHALSALLLVGCALSAYWLLASARLLHLLNEKGVVVVEGRSGSSGAQ